MSLCASESAYTVTDLCVCVCVCLRACMQINFCVCVQVHSVSIQIVVTHNDPELIVIDTSLYIYGNDHVFVCNVCFSQ